MISDAVADMTDFSHAHWLDFDRLLHSQHNNTTQKTQSQEVCSVFRILRKTYEVFGNFGSLWHAVRHAVTDLLRAFLDFAPAVTPAKGAFGFGGTSILSQSKDAGLHRFAAEPASFDWLRVLARIICPKIRTHPPPREVCQLGKVCV